jgi:hypothetical protein
MKFILACTVAMFGLFAFTANAQTASTSPQTTFTNPLASSTSLAPILPTDLPQISDIVATSTATSTTVRWTTDQFSTGEVAYGTSTSYGEATFSDLALYHQVVLPNLSPLTTYHFQIIATNGIGSTLSPDQIFTTPAPELSANRAALTPIEIVVVPTYSIATISWTTQTPANSVVWYGLNPYSYTASTTGLGNLSDTPTTDHLVSIYNLLPDTTYHFRIISSGAAGVSVASPDYYFTTPPMLEL